MTSVSSTEKNNSSFAVIIPVFNHEEMIADVVKKAKKLNYPVIVIDDGSTDSTYKQISDIEGITILRHSENQGKGSAILTGLKEAQEIAGWAVTIDADGQHDPDDAVILINSIPAGLSGSGLKRPVIIGMRTQMDGRDVPWTSRFGRKFSNFWVWLSGGPAVKDSQSGFRIYPLPETIQLKIKTKRYQFEVESLVKAGWKKHPVIEVPVNVCYSPGTKRVSHFRPFIDFLRNSATFTRLITMRILIPGFIRSR
ncbi:MAG: glycosyltransferase family 2 protein [Spirochaetes bacterium]|nr:glycosyltransferase family 2 protein [Spirochaetota bacterium]